MKLNFPQFSRRGIRLLQIVPLLFALVIPRFLIGNDEVAEAVETTQKTQKTEPNPENRTPDKILSIDEIVERAVAVSPALVQATRISDSYRGTYLQAGLQNNPVLAVGNEEMDRYDAGGIQTFVLSQERISSKKRSARQYAVRQEQQVAQVVVSVQEQKVRNDARLAGLRLMVAQQMVIFYRGLLSVCERIVQTTQELVTTGDASRSNYLQAKVERNRAKVAYENALIELNSASNEVALFIGEPKGSLIQVSDTFGELPQALNGDVLLEEYLQNSPQLRQARAEVSAAQAKLVSECREAGIDLTPIGSVRRIDEANLIDFTIGVEIPIRVNDRNQGKIQNAQSLLQAAQSNQERIELGLRSEFEKCFTKYQTAERTVRDYQEIILDETDESYEMVNASYQAGEVSYVELLSSLSVLYNVRIEYIENVQALLNSRALLTGFLLEGAYEKPQ